MKISKKDALMWFRFFAELPEEEELMTHQTEIVFDTLSQIETAVEQRRREKLAQVKGLKSLCGRSFYVGPDDKFPGGCVSCLTGTGLSAIRKTNKCNAACRFCYDYGVLDAIPPIGEGLWEIGGTKFREEDLPLLFSVHKKPTGVSYVYLEPFMEIEKYYGVVRLFAGQGIHQHLYTNGLNANEENLKALGESGLDELRFNLGASRCADKVLESMRLAKKYIPQVGIETPMTPEFWRDFHAKKDTILNEVRPDFINCAELHLNANNLDNYLGENMYMYRQGYLSPIWSRDLTIELMREAADEGWSMLVHDCDNSTKFARDLNLSAREGGWFGQSSYGGEFTRLPYEAFLPVLMDDSFRFLEEEPLPRGYRPGDIVL